MRSGYSGKISVPSAPSSHVLRHTSYTAACRTHTYSPRIKKSSKYTVTIWWIEKLLIATHSHSPIAYWVLNRMSLTLSSGWYGRTLSKGVSVFTGGWYASKSGAVSNGNKRCSSPKGQRRNWKEKKSTQRLISTWHVHGTRSRTELGRSMVCTDPVNSGG